MERVERRKWVPAPGGQRLLGRRWQWQEASGTEWTSETARTEWIGPVLRTAWEAGPFTYPVEAPTMVEYRDTGELSVRTEGGQVHVVYGPWQVVIRGIGARAERRVLSTWEYRRQIELVGGGERNVFVKGTLAPGSSEWLMTGASERMWQGSSELLMRGASELWLLGASELLLRGASETLLSGASEYRLRGSSERWAMGASERLFRGATERRLRRRDRNHVCRGERAAARRRQRALHRGQRALCRRQRTPRRRERTPRPDERDVKRAVRAHARVALPDPRPESRVNHADRIFRPRPARAPALRPPSRKIPR